MELIYRWQQSFNHLESSSSSLNQFNQQKETVHLSCWISNTQGHKKRMSFIPITSLGSICCFACVVSNLTYFQTPSIMIFWWQTSESTWGQYLREKLSRGKVLTRGKRCESMKFQEKLWFPENLFFRGERWSADLPRMEAWGGEHDPFSQGQGPIDSPGMRK